MFTEFFYKKKMRAACGICLAISFGCLWYAYSLFTIKRVIYYDSFYFLVSENMHLEVSAELVKWQGGAGYFLEEDGKAYVAYTVFSKEENGKIIQKNLKEKTLLLQKRVDALYFKGRKKKKANMYISALKLFKSYILLLENCINRLGNGMTQEACKRILNTLVSQFRYAAKEYAEYAAFAKLCVQSGEELEISCQDKVYVKDLRYLLCWQVEEYMGLCNAFSI